MSDEIGDVIVVTNLEDTPIQPHKQPTEQFTNGMTAKMRWHKSHSYFISHNWFPHINAVNLLVSVKTIVWDVLGAIFLIMFWVIYLIMLLVDALGC